MWIISEIIDVIKIVFYLKNSRTLFVTDKLVLLVLCSCIHVESSSKHNLNTWLQCNTGEKNDSDATTR